MKGTLTLYLAGGAQLHMEVDDLKAAEAALEKPRSRMRDEQLIVRSEGSTFGARHEEIIAWQACYEARDEGEDEGREVDHCPKCGGYQGHRLSCEDR